MIDWQIKYRTDPSNFRNLFNFNFSTFACNFVSCEYCFLWQNNGSLSLSSSSFTNVNAKVPRRPHRGIHSAKKSPPYSLHWWLTMYLWNKTFAIIPPLSQRFRSFHCANHWTCLIARDGCEYSPRVHVQWKFQLSLEMTQVLKTPKLD